MTNLKGCENPVVDWFKD